MIIETATRSAQMFNNNNNLKRMMAHTVLCKIKLLHMQYPQWRHNAFGPGPLLGHSNYLETQVFMCGGPYFKPLCGRRAFHLSASPVYPLQSEDTKEGSGVDSPLLIELVSKTFAVLDGQNVTLGTSKTCLFWAQWGLFILQVVPHVEMLKCSRAAHLPPRCLQRFSSARQLSLAPQTIAGASFCGKFPLHGILRLSSQRT